MPSASTTSAPHDGPAFLRGLDHAMPTPEGGWLAQCPMFGCGELLLIDAVDARWRIHCEGSHRDAHAELVEYLQITDLRVDPRPAIRAWLAMRLALTPDAWAGLMLGLPVQPQVIDQLELARLRKAGLW